MGKIIIFKIAIVSLFVGCFNVNKNNMDHIDKEIVESGDEIIEVKADESANAEIQENEFDFVISEAAVGNYENVPFTIAGILDEENEDGEVVFTTYIKINKKETIDLYDGTEFLLKENVKLKIVKIEPAEEENGKGKVYFKRI